MRRPITAIAFCCALCLGLGLSGCADTKHPVFFGDYEWWTLNFPEDQDPFDVKQVEPSPRPEVLEQVVASNVDLKKATFIQLRQYREKAIALYYEVRDAYSKERLRVTGEPDNFEYLAQAEHEKIVAANAKWQQELKKNAQARKIKQDLFVVRGYIKYLGTLVDAKSPN